MRETRAALVKHVGGSPSAVQKLLIERAVSLTLHLAMLDAKGADSGCMSERDSRQYLAWSNSTARLLRQLGMDGVPERQPTMKEFLAKHAAGKAAAA